MQVIVSRTGGFAGIRVTWRVRVEEQPDRAEWRALVESMPWDDAPSLDTPPSGSQPDRYVYRIAWEQHEAVLPERQLEGPWRILVERVRERSTPTRPGDAPD
jgi:hypothetical protein